MAIEAPLWMDPNPATGVGPEYSARQDRGIIGALFTEGVGDVQGGDLAVTQRAAGANMTVTVAPGAAYVAGDDVARQGTYRVVVTTAESVTIPAAPSSGSRIDLVVLRVYDASAIGGSRNAAFVEAVTGTPGSSPSAPNLPATAIPLARVTVAAGSSSVVTANIADLRAQSGANVLRVGTQAQPMTQAQRDALSGNELFVGRLVENTTTGLVEHYRASGWSPVTPGPVVVSTSINAPAFSTTESGIVYTVPLGVAFREAWVQFGSGAFLVTPNEGDALGVAGVTGTSFNGSSYLGATGGVGGFVRGQTAQGGTREELSALRLSGSTLLVTVNRFYTSGNAIPASSLPIKISGRL